MPVPVLLFLALGVLAALAAAVRWSLVVAAPDEWLLVVRHGRAVVAGVGLRGWRLPGDTVARFSSTLQRVTFQVEVQTCEHLTVALQGYVLWAVGQAPADALNALKNLGLVNTANDAGAARLKHVLAKPQHHAFRAYVCAELQTFMAQHSLAETLALSDEHSAALLQRMRRFMTGVGVELTQFELVSAQPTDPRVRESLAGPHREQLKLDADRAEVSANEAIRLARVEAEARVNEAAAEAALAAAEWRRRAEEAEAAVRRTKHVGDAETHKAVSLLATEAESAKSEEVRRSELQRLAIERATEAVKQMQIAEAKWVSVGEHGGPTGQVLALTEVLRSFAGHQQVAQKRRTE